MFSIPLPLRLIMSWCMQELPEGIPIVFASAVFGMAPNSTAMVRKVKECM